MTNRERFTLTGGTRIRAVAALSVLAIVLLWAGWPTLCEMTGRWSHDPRYSHGFLVPAFAAYLLWQRRSMLSAGPIVASWSGIPLIVAGEAIRLAGARYYVDWFEAIAILPTLAGTCLVIGGWRALRWAAPAIGFLFFMIPLPYRVEMAVGYPLQRAATVASGFALQTMGLPAVIEGNVILLNNAKIGVVEACNGLGMLFMFFAFAVATALVIRRSVIDKALIVAGAVPIAMAANITRISVTGLLHETAGGPVADVVYHDLAGWLMMPLALAALWLELFILSRLFVESAVDRPLPISLGLAGGASSPRRRGPQRPGQAGSPLRPDRA